MALAGAVTQSRARTPIQVLISLSVIDLSIKVCVKSKTISLVVLAVQVVLGLWLTSTAQAVSEARLARIFLLIPVTHTALPPYGHISSVPSRSSHLKAGGMVLPELSAR